MLDLLATKAVQTIVLWLSLPKARAGSWAILSEIQSSSETSVTWQWYYPVPNRSSTASQGQGPSEVQLLSESRRQGMWQVLCQCGHAFSDSTSYEMYRGKEASKYEPVCRLQGGQRVNQTMHKYFLALTWSFLAGDSSYARAVWRVSLVCWDLQKARASHWSRFRRWFWREIICDSYW